MYFYLCSLIRLVPAQPKPQTPNKGKKNKNIKSTEEPEAPLDKHEAEERSRASDYANTQDLFKGKTKLLIFLMIIF